MIGDSLYSWVDVQYALEGAMPEWPRELHTARAYWDGVVVEVVEGHEQLVLKWLKDRFGPRWNDSPPSIRLESLSEHPPRRLSVSLDPVADADPPVGWSRRSFRKYDTAMRRQAEPRAEDCLEPGVYAFHSFKGGVGRTTAAVQFAQLVAALPGTSVMLVDMDFEAPGISWMTGASRLPTPPISVGDLLALVHSSPAEGVELSIGLAASRLRDSLVDGMVILPAFRTGHREADVRPEHLETPGMPSLGSVLSRLAMQLSVSHVVVDLRAGRSELSASLLLDPAVSRVLVTTTAGQSLKGTVEMLRDLWPAFPQVEGNPPITIVLSKLVAPATEEFHRAKAQLTEEVEALLATRGSDDEADGSFPVRFTAALHDEGLLTLPLDWESVVERLNASGSLSVDALPTDLSFSQWAAEVGATPGDPPAQDIDGRRQLLADFAGRMVHAEGAGTGPFLDTGFLRQLVQAHRSRLPVVAAIGAKGSGKTFTFLRLLAHETWASFAQATKIQTTEDGEVIPITWPKNLSGAALALVDSRLSDQSGAQAALAFSDLLDAARNELTTLGEWREWWVERLIERGGGGQPGDVGNPDAIGGGQVFVMDGLEDMLPHIHRDQKEQLCLRALLQEVPAWLKAAGSRAGLIVFVRMDYVRAAIPQNTEQFRSLHRAYELRWDRKEALRLVRWTAAHARAVADEGSGDEQLVRLWGRKLGSDKSREAVSQNWVLDALSTRQDEVQARDLVRLLAVAASKSVGHGWGERLLAPQAVRDALEEVGEKKIKEILEERPSLGNALERFRALSNTIRIPFGYSDLTADDDRLALIALEDAGIAWREGDEIWLVSLYRRGLGLQLQPHRRERVLR